MHNLPPARSLSDGAGIILWASKPVKRALGIIVGMERSEQTTPPHEAGRANTAVHSITKSARAKSDCGAARFCALTIFKLMRLASGPRSAACPSKLGADRRRGGVRLPSEPNRKMHPRVS